MCWALYMSVDGVKSGQARCTCSPGLRFGAGVGVCVIRGDVKAEVQVEHRDGSGCGVFALLKLQMPCRNPYYSY